MVTDLGQVEGLVNAYALKATPPEGQRMSLFPLRRECRLWVIPRLATANISLG